MIEREIIVKKISKSESPKPKKDLVAMFDTQTVVKVAITAVGDSRTGQIENTLGPVQFANTGKIQNSINGIEW